MGYYRVLYNEDNWQNIIEELKRDHGTFSALVSQKCLDYFREHEIYFVYFSTISFRIVLGSYQTPLLCVTLI